MPPHSARALWAAFVAGVEPSWQPLPPRPPPAPAGRGPGWRGSARTPARGPVPPSAPRSFGVTRRGQTCPEKGLSPQTPWPLAQPWQLSWGGGTPQGWLSRAALHSTRVPMSPSLLCSVCQRLSPCMPQFPQERTCPGPRFAALASAVLGGCWPGSCVTSTVVLATTPALCNARRHSLLRLDFCRRRLGRGGDSSPRAPPPSAGGCPQKRAGTAKPRPGQVPSQAQVPAPARRDFPPALPRSHRGATCVGGRRKRSIFQRWKPRGKRLQEGTMKAVNHYSSAPPAEGSGEDSALEPPKGSTAQGRGRARAGSVRSRRRPSHGSTGARGGGVLAGVRAAPQRREALAGRCPVPRLPTLPGGGSGAAPRLGRDEGQQGGAMGGGGTRGDNRGACRSPSAAVVGRGRGSWGRFEVCFSCGETRARTFPLHRDRGGTVETPRGRAWGSDASGGRFGGRARPPPRKSSPRAETPSATPALTVMLHFPSAAAPLPTLHLAAADASHGWEPSVGREEEGDAPAPRPLTPFSGQAALPSHAHPTRGAQKPETSGTPQSRCADAASPTSPRPEWGPRCCFNTHHPKNQQGKTFCSSHGARGHSALGTGGVAGAPPHPKPGWFGEEEEEDSQAGWIPRSLGGVRPCSAGAELGAGKGFASG